MISILASVIIVYQTAIRQNIQPQLLQPHSGMYKCFDFQKNCTQCLLQPKAPQSSLEFLRDIQQDLMQKLEKSQSDLELAQNGKIGFDFEMPVLS